jgi:hypothetical protein
MRPPVMGLCLESPYRSLFPSELRAMFNARLPANRAGHLRRRVHGRERKPTQSMGGGERFALVFVS